MRPPCEIRLRVRPRPISTPAGRLATWTPQRSLVRSHLPLADSRAPDPRHPFDQRRISTSSTHALTTPETREKMQPGASQYIPAGEPRSSRIPEIQNGTLANWVWIMRVIAQPRG